MSNLLRWAQKVICVSYAIEVVGEHFVYPVGITVVHDESSLVLLLLHFAGFSIFTAMLEYISLQ